MAGRLSFSIAINLLTENFKKGTNTVKNGFRSMQAQILTFAAALGFAGVSLSNFVSEIIRVARETGKAVTMLKNVSGSTAQFADNLRFTTALAKKYGVYVNDITANFAKFTAAASIAGMSMEDQHKLFESLSKASAAFGMSADETNGVFLAVTQMMGKGKIQAEELRGQLGERLPIAMQAMAKAAGTTVAGLDKIMKEGKLLSAEVLPGFADALNEMIPNVDTDNIETSLNRLRNAFQGFTQNTGVQDVYKKLIDGLTSFVNYAQGRLSSLITFVIALVSGKLLTNIVSFFKQQNDVLNSAVKKHAVAETQKQLATQKRIEAEKLLEAIKTDYETTENGKRLASKAQVTKAKKALETAELMEKKAVLAAGTAAENAAAVQGMGLWKKTGAVIVASAKRAALALKAVWSTVGPMVLITVISTVITKLVDTYQEAKRVRNIFNEYKKSAGNISSPVEKPQLEALKRIAEDTTRSTKNRTDAWAELANRMNVVQKKNETELEFHKRINGEIAKRIKLLENTAAADFYAAQKVEANDKFKTLQKELGIQNMDPMGTEYLMQQISSYSKTGSKKAQVEGLQRYYREVWNTNGKFVKDYENKLIEMSGYWDVMVDATKEIEEATARLLENKTKDTPVDLDTNKKKKSPLEKAEESYAQKIRELEARREVEKMSISQYNKALDDLNKSALIEAKASGDKQILESQYYKKLQSAVANLNYTEEQKAQDEFLAVKKEYTEAVQKLKNQLDNGAIDQKKFNEDLASLADTTVLTAGALSGIGEAGKEFITALQKTASEARAVPIPQYKERDKTFDYKKTNLEKLQADRDNRQDYVDKLKGKIGGDADEIEEKLKTAKGNLEAIKKEYGSVAAELIVELNNAMGNVTTLDKALKIAEVKQDIKDLTKELNQGIYSGVKDIASNADRLVSAFSSLSDVMSDEDATTWERILAVWNAMTNTTDAFLSVIKTIENLTEIVKKLKAAKGQDKTPDTPEIAQSEISTANAVAIREEAAANIELASSIEILKNAKGEKEDVTLDYQEVEISREKAAAAREEAAANIELAASIGILKSAKEDAAESDNTQTQKEISNSSSKLSSLKSIVSTGMSLDDMAADKKVETATKEVAANTAAGASEAGKGAAKLPFPWNIVAIGGAIAAALAAFAMIPKFAAGGIAQGSTSGDNNLVRVNGGEMILNGRQQATLFQIANGKGIRTVSDGGKVEFELRYDRLVGVLKNGDQKLGRGR